MGKIKKYGCSACNREWFSSDNLKEEISYHREDFDKSHKVILIKNLTAKDYVEMWSDDLESANRHSLTDLPETIYKTLKRFIADEEVIAKIIKSLYENEVGV